MASQNYSKLLIVWATGDKDVALNMVLTYAINSKLHDWWKEVVLLIWGSSSRLSAQDKEIQQRIASAQNEGVRVIACKKCAENMHVVQELEQLGVEVFYTGEFLTNWLKSGEQVLTF